MGKTFNDLKPSDCRWPLGEATEPARFFCGEPRAATSLRACYCATHYAMAYQPGSLADPASTAALVKRFGALRPYSSGAKREVYRPISSALLRVMFKGVGGDA